MTSKIQLISAGADYSGLGLGQLVAAYNPYTDAGITILGAWDADDSATFTVDGGNNVLTMPSKFGGFVLTPFNAGFKPTYQPNGWAGGNNPTNPNQQTGAFSFTGATGTNSTCMSGTGPAAPAGGVTVFALAQRGAQIARASGVGARALMSLGVYPYAAGNPPYQYSFLGVMDATSDPAQTAAVFGQHVYTLASDASMTSFANGDKGVLTGQATGAGHAAGLNGAEPIGAAGYFNVVSQSTQYTWSLGSGWNSVDGGFTGLCKVAMVVSNTGLTQAKRQKIEAWLAWRGGIQAKLPSTHTYFADGP